MSNENMKTSSKSLPSTPTPRTVYMDPKRCWSIFMDKRLVSSDPFQNYKRWHKCVTPSHIFVRYPKEAAAGWAILSETVRYTFSREVIVGFMTRIEVKAMRNAAIRHAHAHQRELERLRRLARSRNRRYMI